MKTKMKFGDAKVTTRAPGACLQGSGVQIEEGVLHLWRVSDSKGRGHVYKRPINKKENVTTTLKYTNGT